MAFRLFGRSTKKSSAPSNSGQEQADNSAEDDGFTVVAAEEQPPLIQISNAQPSVNSSNPYGYTTPGYSPYPVGSSQTQAAAPAKKPVHYLDGVPFVLGNGSSESDIDAILARVESASEKLKSINWGVYEYDFGIEKTVIEQDITATMKRMKSRDDA